METELPLAIVAEFRNGPITDYIDCGDREQALEAAGLSEEAMSEENVEVVRGFYESLNEWLASYWSDPEQPLEQSPGLEEVFDRLDPAAEWDWLFSPETFRGREQLLQAVADYLETVGDWRVELEELIDGTRDRVLGIGRVVAQGKGSGAPVLQPIFSAFTVRNGKVARIEDHTERAKALEAVGLSE